MPRAKSSAARPLRSAKETAGERHERDSLRQAECAAMLIAVTRMLLDLRGRDFATWLRSIADDFEATDPETEDPEDIAVELIRMSTPDEEFDDGAQGETGERRDEPGAGPRRGGRTH